MTVVHFLGRVVPHGVSITLTNLPSFSLEPIEKDGESWEFQLDIKNSIVKVSCISDSPRELSESSWRCTLAAKIALNLFAFQTGSGISVELDTYIDEHNRLHTIARRDERLAEQCTAFDVRTDFNAAFQLVNTHPWLFMALDDLIESLRSATAPAVNCSRAIDGIRNLIATEKLSPADQWAVMREKLNVDRSYLQLMSDVSKEPRHGKRTSMEAATTDEILKRTWAVMNRYLEYLKRGSTSLPLRDFPLLSQRP